MRQRGLENGICDSSRLWRRGPAARRGRSRRGAAARGSDVPALAKKKARHRRAFESLRRVGENQKPLTFRRPLLTTLPLHEAVGTDKPMMPAFTSAAVAPRRVDLYNAAAPATCGDAIEVPLKLA